MSFYIYETTTETKGEVEMTEKWANIEVGDVLINSNDGRLGRYARVWELDSNVIVVDVSSDNDIGWLKGDCELYAKKSDVTILKEKKGISTVIEYKGDRYIYDSPTAYRGGAKRAQTTKT